ncbi:MAG: cytochrome c3 family protein [Anaerolineae bacterium]|nr:cytochrome c3 family protein [Anaerolineae bacterium]
MILAVIVVVVAVIGTAAVWGHFWDFRVGDPQATSCTSCHVLDSFVESQGDTDLLIGVHAARGIVCVDCHEFNLDRQLSETVSYLTQDYTDPLMSVRYGMDSCFKCHEHASYEQIAWRTTDLGVTDAQASGHNANPHQPPHYTNLECNSCHMMHEPSTLLCWECHQYQFKWPREMPTEEAPVNP